MSGPTTFSYAQAAKGHKAQTSTQPTTPNGQSESHARDDASSVTTGGDGTAKTFSTTSEISESAKSSQIDVDVGPKKVSDANAADSGVPTEPSRDNSTTQAEETKTAAQPSPNEKSGRQSNRSGEQNDSKKGRKGRKGKSSDKEPESEQAPAEPEKEVIPVKLFEAPPPAVNIWQQRAAAAKAKQPTTSPSPPVTAELSSKAAPETATKKAGAEDATTSERVRAPAKSAEGSRPSTDQGARRNPRGSREKGEPSPSHNTPAVGDASMWPTPETAATADDEKRGKSVSDADQSAKEKQDDSAQPKTIRQKRDWKKVDITPTVIFNTPMPQPRTMNKARGGSHAARNSVSRGHVASASVSNEKPQGPTPEAPASKEEPQPKPREDAPPRNNSIPAEKAKKFSVDHQSTRKQPMPAPSRGDYPPAPKNDAPRASKNDSPHAFPSRGDGHEGRKEGGFSGHKENSKPRRGAHGGGRGGHNGGQAPYGQPFMSNGHNSRPSTYIPPNFTPNGHQSSGYGGSGRGGRRPVSMSNGYKGPSNGAPKMHVQPPVASEYGQYPPYGQAPYSPYGGLNQEYFDLVHTTLKSQIEYYFSADNLPKDLFLRSKMDAQGFVPIDVIGSFPRIRQISGQNLDFVRAACADSQDIDYVLGDGKELLRRREGWQKYLVPEDNKKEQARAPGPSNFVFRSKHSLHLNSAYHQQQPPLHYPYNPMSPPAYAPSYPGDMYAGYMNGAGFPPATNSAAPVNGQPAGEDTGLNAAVPEFSPKFSNGGFIDRLNEPTGEWVDHALQAATTFTDEQVAGLHVVARGEPAQSMANGKKSEDAKTNGAHT